MSDSVDCAIVGGGIHGCYLARHLLEETTLKPSQLALIDPHDRLLASFRSKARACGMDTLRSSYVQHLGTDPFGLEAFAEEHDREDELRSTVDYPPRPSLELFLDHATAVSAGVGLADCHRQAIVESITERGTGGGVRLETAAGTIEANACVLAIGHGGRYRWPDWAAELEYASHVWDGFEPAADVERTVIVGGGITAVQLACELCETQSVALIPRHPFEWAVAEAEPPWINWAHIEAELHEAPPGSKERYEIAMDARNRASIPPFLYSDLETHLESGQLTIAQGEVVAAEATADGVECTLEYGLDLVGDRLVCATGFEPPFDDPFVERVAEELTLERGAHEMPLLDDATLAWQDRSGTPQPIFVTGALALGTVGPYAPNLPGAKRASERIAGALEGRLYSRLEA